MSVTLGIDIGSIYTKVVGIYDDRSDYFYLPDGGDSKFFSILAVDRYGDVLIGADALSDRRLSDSENAGPILQAGFESQLRSCMGMGYCIDGIVDVGRCIEQGMDAGNYIAWLNGNFFAPGDVLGMYVQALVHRAEQHCNDTVSAVCVAFPIYLNEPQIVEIEQALKRVGLSRSSVVPQNVAAVFDYSLDLSQEQLILVIDAGYKTCSCSVLHCNTVTGLQAIGMRSSRHGLDSCGKMCGIDFADDDAGMLSQKIWQQYGVSVSADDLFAEANYVVEHWWYRDKVDVPWGADGKGNSIEVTEQDLSPLATPIIHQIGSEVVELFTSLENPISLEDVDSVALMGGGSYMPFYPEFFSKVTNTQIDTSVRPDNAAAYGAAAFGMLR